VDLSQYTLKTMIMHQYFIFNMNDLHFIDNNRFSSDGLNKKLLVCCFITFLIRIDRIMFSIILLF